MVVSIATIGSFIVAIIALFVSWKTRKESQKVKNEFNTVKNEFNTIRTEFQTIKVNQTITGNIGVIVNGTYVGVDGTNFDHSGEKKPIKITNLEDKIERE